MELDLGDTFLLPTETWDIYPRDKMSGYRYEAYYNRLPPFPLINYKSVDTNIKTCVLTKGASDGVSKYISLKVIIRLSDEPHEKLYNTDIETMSVCSDSKNNPYYFEEIEYRTRIAFEYQDYLYVIVVDTEQSEHNASSIAYEMYYDMRYGGVACNTNNKCIYTSD